MRDKRVKMLTDTDARVIAALESGIPLEPAPFSIIAASLGMTEPQLLAKTKALLKSEAIRRMGAVLNRRASGFATTLAAAKAAESRDAAAIGLINSYVEVTHHYRRGGCELDLWFTIVAPCRARIDEILSDLKASGLFDRILELPATRVFKLDARFSKIAEDCSVENGPVKDKSLPGCDRKIGDILLRQGYGGLGHEVSDKSLKFEPVGLLKKCAMAGLVPPCRPGSGRLSAVTRTSAQTCRQSHRFFNSPPVPVFPVFLETVVAAVLAAGLEPVGRPYRAASKAADCSEGEFIAVARSLAERGFIRRVAAVVNPRALGLRGAALVAWRVKAASIGRAGEKLAAATNVTHCYARKPAPQWPYNLYTMVHGVDEESVRGWAAKAAADLGALDHVVLTTREELKERAPAQGTIIMETGKPRKARNTRKGAGHNHNANQEPTNGTKAMRRRKAQS